MKLFDLHVLAVMLLALVVIAACKGPAFSADADAPFTLAGLGDCEKITKDGAIPESPHFWDAKSKRLKLHAGRNETAAAQLMLSAKADVKGVNVEIGDLKGPGVIPANPNIQPSLELYQFVAHGDWSWGPPSQVLPSKKWYPEVLAPFKDPYGPEHKPVGAPFSIEVANGPNQGVWIDVYVPKDTPAGMYEAQIKLTVNGDVKATAALELKVNNFTLPDETHVDGYGEFYGNCYDFHGVSFKQDPDKWWSVAKRYQQMAHQHRFVIFDRYGRGPGLNQWEAYDKTYGQVLDGTLFTADQGYTGPGVNTGVNFWGAPFAQSYDGSVPDFDEGKLKSYSDGAKAFWDHVVEKKWDKKRFLAYIIDEAGSDARARTNTKKLQDALDAGAGKGHVNLLWTSHTDPSTLAADSATDMRGVIRWWSPNGGACNPGFLVPREKEGETVWFYHSGHPCVGVHGVNASGIELRTWGAICWRYKVNGSFWWAMDMGDTKAPLAKPVYKPDDTRWGNGVLFYPGARLTDVGLPAIDGPLSCMRMKAYRRGLQDYEYGWLLKQQNKESIADQLVKKVIPVALTEALGNPGLTAKAGEESQKTEQSGQATGASAGGKGGPSWSTDVNAWYQMRKDLAAELNKGAVR
jgi:hypothetical protein